MWNKIITLYAGFCGKGMIVALFFLALIYLFFKEKNKNNRMMFVYMPIVILILYFCPAVAAVVYALVSEDLYWRFLWLLPMTPVIAYAAVKVISSLQGKKQVFAGVCLGGMIIASGSLIYNSSTASPAKNYYHVPESVIAVCDLIEPEEGKVKAAFPWEMFQYVRQYSASIEMPYGREYILLSWARRSDLFLALAEGTLNPELIAELARKEGCEYLVFSAGKVIDGEFEDFGFEQVGSTHGYVIYQDAK